MNKASEPGTTPENTPETTSEAVETAEQKALAQRTEHRLAREAKALRANLLKRKSQMRERK
ncbi:hypothetical protein [Kiloniella laminariae]|uniref:hypothetical protein n=1 Tax=Kiloniella laminariae TaxID=454162 RepID=UPI00035FA3BA|nr:hypothetical protein [Kiloniella laminariae]